MDLELIREYLYGLDLEAYLKASTNRTPSPGQEVWPSHVEDAFLEAVRIFATVGQRKYQIDSQEVDDRPAELLGRNDIISRYIFLKTNEFRARKQVSSHIQVWAHCKKPPSNHEMNVEAFNEVQKIFRHHYSRPTTKFDDLRPADNGASSKKSRRKVHTVPSATLSSIMDIHYNEQQQQHKVPFRFNCVSPTSQHYHQPVNSHYKSPFVPLHRPQYRPPLDFSESLGVSTTTPFVDPLAQFNVATPVGSKACNKFQALGKRRVPSLLPEDTITNSVAMDCKPISAPMALDIFSVPWPLDPNTMTAVIATNTSTADSNNKVYPHGNSGSVSLTSMPPPLATGASRCVGAGCNADAARMSDDYHSVQLLTASAISTTATSDVPLDSKDRFDMQPQSTLTSGPGQDNGFLVYPGTSLPTTAINPATAIAHMTSSVPAASTAAAAATATPSFTIASGLFDCFSASSTHQNHRRASTTADSLFSPGIMPNWCVDSLLSDISLGSSSSSTNIESSMVDRSTTVDNISIRNRSNSADDLQTLPNLVLSNSTPSPSSIGLSDDRHNNDNRRHQADYPCIGSTGGNWLNILTALQENLEPRVC
ncbi:hypothetical protein EV182_000824 [Spiromyces aspiralis]|uniref:Uncharacterized protein n=1 Tax=Spiromyces aspiralis TaxID=68401 RepID=A0ACC1HH40_9FUNG|nr:hypothetical protein EV182_000824 [Spiromyces aspiralis]